MPKIKEKIRQDISQNLGTLIPQNKWDAYIDLLDREGKFTRKSMLMMLITACKHIEVLEELVEDLYTNSNSEMVSGETKTSVTLPVLDTVRLKTPMDVYSKLDSQLTQNSKTLYISKDDWKILEINMDPALANKDPKYGFGKETDPRDNKVKTCMWYKDYPVFKL